MRHNKADPDALARALGQTPRRRTDSDADDESWTTTICLFAAVLIGLMVLALTNPTVQAILLALSQAFTKAENILSRLW